MMSFNPNDWYYRLRNDPTQVFSTARGVFVPATDAAYVAWKAVEDNFVIPVDTAAEIGQALAQFMVRPTDATVLDGYQNTQADNVVAQLAFKMLFNHENRIRALEGKPTITVAQARAALKAMM